MKRREFFQITFKSLPFLATLSPLKKISSQLYNELISEGIALRFAVASDGHFGQPDTPFEQYHSEMINWLNKESAGSELSFVMFNGDLVHDKIELYPVLKKQFDQLSMPYHISRGNHDLCNVDVWKKNWERDLNYTFTVGKNCFVVLDTSNERGEFVCPDLEWTTQALHDNKHHENMFIFMHITPQRWTHGGVNCPKVVDLFSKQKNLRAIFHGHDHNEDFVKEAKGKPFFFDGHLGGNWGTDYRGYRIVEITNKNEIITYQVNPAKEERVNSKTLM